MSKKIGGTRSKLKFAFKSGCIHPIGHGRYPGYHQLGGKVKIYVKVILQVTVEEKVQFEVLLRVPTTVYFKVKDKVKVKSKSRAGSNKVRANIR